MSVRRKFKITFGIFLAVSLALIGTWFVAGTSRTFSVEGGPSSQNGFLNAVKTFASIPFIPEQDLKGEENLRVNILLLGVSGPGYESPELTDTIVVASLNTETKNIALVSLPRDLLIELPESRLVSRINTLYLVKKQDDERKNNKEFNSHTELVRTKAEEITGLYIPYVILLNVAALEEMVNALEGINIFVEHDIVDPTFPTTGYGYERFTIEKGWRFLDGATAQKYVRTRHDIRGDFGRMERQQQVIGAIINKARGLNLITDFPKILSLVSTLGNNLQTNANNREIKRAWNLSKDIDINRIKTLALDGGQSNSLLVDYRPQLGATIASTLVPRAGIFDYSEIQQAIQAILN